MAFGKWQGFLNDSVNAVKGASPPEPPSRPPVAQGDLHPWDSRRQLLTLSDAGDVLTLGDCFTGLAALGQTGGGKTSILAIVGVLLMKLECGFVWLCAKPEEVQLVRRLAKRAGREADVVVLGEDVDGQITPERFNPLDYEMNAPRASARAVVDYLHSAYEVLSRDPDKPSGGGEDGGRFWDDQFKRLLRYCLQTGRLAGRPLSVQLLRRIQLSAPTKDNAAVLSDEDWKQRSALMQCIREAEARETAGEVNGEDVQDVIDFWMNDYFNLDQKPRSTVDVMFADLVDAFKAEEPIRSILTTTTTVTPEDVMERGKIVVLSLPTRLYHAPGRMAQYCFKASFQRAMLRRKPAGEGEAPLRPTVLWVDEAHNFAHPKDAEYFHEVRSFRGINVWLEQGVDGYGRAIGTQRQDSIDGFLSGLTSKFFFANQSPATNEFAAKVIGKRMLTKESQNWNQGEDGTRGGGGETTEERWQVLPGEFSELRTGGFDNELWVDAYVVKRGTKFKATGRNYLLCHFRQTELTK